MKLQRFILSAIIFLIVGVLVNGCGHSHNDDDAHDEEHSAAEHDQDGISFIENKGLSVPKNTADFIGLKIADVKERKTTSTLRFSAQVYRSSTLAKQNATSDFALASGFLRNTDTERLKVGQSVTLETKAGLTLAGKIIAFDHQLEKANGLIEVLLEIDDIQKTLAIGSYVEAVVATGKEKVVVSVPRAALLRTAQGNFVYMVSGEHLVRSEVEVGEMGDELVQVKEGLHAGDQVVVNPVMTLWMAELQSIRGGAHEH